MSVVIKTSEMQYRDGSGAYHGINAIAEKKIADQEAALDAKIASTQAAVNSLEAQKNTIAATVASMAQLGTDTTFTTPGMAADAATVGDLRSAIGAIPQLSEVPYIPSEITLATGKLTETGVKTSANAKSIVNFLALEPNTHYLIDINNDGYNIIDYCCLYTGATASTFTRYLPIYGKRFISFTTSSTEKYIRMTTCCADETTNMTDTDRNNIAASLKLYTFTDSTLTLRNIPADAYAVGNRIEDIEGASYHVKQIVNLTGEGDGYANGHAYNTVTDVERDDQPDYFMSEYISVFPGQIAKLNYPIRSSTWGHVFYDEGKNKIGSILSDEENKTFTIPNNVRYIRFTGRVRDRYMYSFSINVPSMEILLEQTNRFNFDDSSRISTMKVNTVSYTDNKTFLCKQFTIADINGYFLTDPIYVRSGVTIRLNYDINSETYGHMLLDENKQVVSCISASYQNREFSIPEGCSYIRLTGHKNRRDLYSVSFLDGVTNKNNPLAFLENKKTIKTTSDLYSVGLKEYKHLAFPGMCFFGWRKVIAFRFGMGHRTPTDTNEWGGIRLIADDKTAFRTIATLQTSDFIGLDGELRDTHIQPTPDGKYMILATWTTYYTSYQMTIEGNTETVYGTAHDNLLVCFDQDFNIVDYIIDKFDPSVDVSRTTYNSTSQRWEFTSCKPLYCGNPLITPFGYLIIAGYTSEVGLYVYRSTSVFDGSFSQMTKILAYANQQDEYLSENCLGYFNDELYMVARRYVPGAISPDPASSIMLKASNAESDSNATWGDRKDLTEWIHNPKLFPVWKGNMLPIFGAVCKQKNRDRYAAFGFISNIDALTPTVELNKIDETLPMNYGGYCGVIRLNNLEYEATYYEETVLQFDSDNASSGMYVKEFNVFELLPGMVYKM